MRNQDDSAPIEIYFDYRSPYAYFLWSDMGGLAANDTVTVSTDWRPVSVGILLNLQQGREAWAAYEDPLPSVKRRYLYADVARGAEYRGLPIQPPNPFRPDSLLALQTDIVLAGSCVRHEFRDRVFRAVWEKQRDISERTVLARLLEGLVNVPRDVVDSATAAQYRAELERRSCDAFHRGVFGVPTMCWEGEIFFGADRLDLLKWRLRRKRRGASPDGGTR